MYDEYKNHDIAIFGGYLKDKDEVLKSASGGVATSMTTEILRRGGIVVGVAYKQDFSGAEYVMVDNFEDVPRLRGSKVIEVDKGQIFQEVKKKLDEGREVLFFGLPCIVKGLKTFLREEYERLVTCDLICSGQTYAEVHSEFCSALESKYKSKIASFSVRYKKQKWLPEYLHVVFENGRIFEEPFKATEYGIAFKILKKEGCCKCKVKGNYRVGDLMIGDFWGSKESDDFWNEKGVSVIFVHTRKGLDLLNSLQDFVKYESTFEYAVDSNLSVIQQIKILDEREKLLPLFKAKGLHAAMKNSHIYKRARWNYMEERVLFFRFLRRIRHKLSKKRRV